MTDVRKTDAGVSLRAQIARIIDEHSVDTVKIHGRLNASHRAVRDADYAFDKADEIIALYAAPAPQCDAEPVTLEQLHFNEIKRSQALEAECDRLRSLLAAPARCDAPIADSKAPWRCSNCGEQLHAAPPSRLDAGSADDIRALGWSVAVHNDYQQNGEVCTFWLFTKDGRAIKGEGRTDIEALNEVRSHLPVTDEPGREAIAFELWQRFAPTHHIGWKDETHKAEYLAAADAIRALSEQKQ